MSSQRIPSSAGTFRVHRENRIIHGRKVRVCALVFTTPDGYVGECTIRGRFTHREYREAYEAALAARAAAQFKARGIVANELPKTYATCAKAAPAAQLLTAIKDTLLFSEVERRGYEVAIA